MINYHVTYYIDTLPSSLSQTFIKASDVPLVAIFLSKVADA